jgi:solute carrier family 25 protein 34/35
MAAYELFASWLAAGSANALTSALLHPLDRARVLQQLQPGPSLRAVLLGVHQRSGLAGLWLPGLQASMLRELLYSGPRIGLYVSVRDAVDAAFGGSAGSVPLKVATGVCTGVLGCVLSNPIDVVKVRLMARPEAFASTLGALPAILAAEGARGLYKGLAPSALRGAAMTVGQIVVYDVSKQGLRGALALQEGPALHVAASLVTGACATLLSAPFDVIKTRAMACPERQESIASVLRALRAEGGLPGSLFRGLLPAYLRQAPFVLICMPLMEQLRAALGLGYV